MLMLCCRSAAALRSSCCLLWQKLKFKNCAQRTISRCSSISLFSLDSCSCLAQILFTDDAKLQDEIAKIATRSGENTQVFQTNNFVWEARQEKQFPKLF